MLWTVFLFLSLTLWPLFGKSWRCCGFLRELLQKGSAWWKDPPTVVYSFSFPFGVAITTVVNVNLPIVESLWSLPNLRCCCNISSFFRCCWTDLVRILRIPLAALVCCHWKLFLTLTIITHFLGVRCLSKDLGLKSILVTFSILNRVI